jgi:hypothetical protein
MSKSKNGEDVNRKWKIEESKLEVECKREVGAWWEILKYLGRLRPVPARSLRLATISLFGSYRR